MNVEIWSDVVCPWCYLGNTFDAHRLLHLARDHGVQPEMKERLMRATFTEGLPIADQSTLARLATEASQLAE